MHSLQLQPFGHGRRQQARFPAETYLNCAGSCINDAMVTAFAGGGWVPDSSACNYNPDATDAGNCEYAPDHYDCQGACNNDADGDGVCDELEVAGARHTRATTWPTDEEACIYLDRTLRLLRATASTTKTAMKCATNWKGVRHPIRAKWFLAVISTGLSAFQEAQRSLNAPILSWFADVEYCSLSHFGWHCRP